MSNMSVRVSTVSSDIFIQFSVSHLYISSEALRTRFGMDVDVLDKSIDFFSGVTYPVICSFLIGATFPKSGIAAILIFKFTQKRIIKNILAFRSRTITIFMSKPLIFRVSDFAVT